MIWYVCDPCGIGASLREGGRGLRRNLVGSPAGDGAGAEPPPAVQAQAAPALYYKITAAAIASAITK